MVKVLPIIIICSIGIAAALGYIAYAAVAAYARKRGKKRNEFEMEEDTLIIKLGRRKRK